MNRADLHHAINAENAFDMQTIASDTTTVGEIIDMVGKVNIDFAIKSGVLTDGAYTVLLEDGDAANLSDAAAVPAANRLGDLPAFALAEDQTVKRVGLFPRKRYCRLSIVSTATTSGGLFTANAVFEPDLTLTT